MRDLSVEQQRTLTVVVCLTLLHGRMPTLREMAAVLGCSREAARCRLHYLEKKGFWNAKRWGITEAGLRETRATLDRAIPGLVEQSQGPARNQHRVPGHDAL